MLRRVVLLGCILAFPHLASAGDKPSVQEELQGTWQMVDLEGNGEKKPADEVQGLKIVFEGDRLWLIKPEGADPKLKYHLDPAKKTIDLTVLEGKDAGKVVPGIYSLEKGQLRLCINIFGDSSIRPSEYKTQQGDGAVFATLERSKAK